MKFPLIGLALAVGFAACSADPAERPVAGPGEIMTVVDENTPEIGLILQDLAVGPDGTLYLAYVSPSVIVAVPKEGSPTVLADTFDRAFPDPRFFRPAALSLNPDDGTIYVADDDEGLIRSIDREDRRRNVVRLAPSERRGSSEDDILEGLQYLAFDARSDWLYVASSCQVARVRDDDSKRAEVVAGVPCVQPSGVPEFGEGVPALDGDIRGMNGLAIDPKNGDVVLSISGGSKPGSVYRIDHDGRVMRIFEGHGRPRTLDEATSMRRLIGGDLAFDDGGDSLYIADPVGSVIRRLSSDGEMRLVAGTGDYEATGDGGPAVDASLEAANRIAIDGEGNLYVNGKHMGATVRMIGSGGN